PPGSILLILIVRGLHTHQYHLGQWLSGLRVDHLPRHLICAFRIAKPNVYPGHFLAFLDFNDLRLILFSRVRVTGSRIYRLPTSGGSLGVDAKMITTGG